MKNSINLRIAYAAAFLDPSIASMIPKICEKITRWKIEKFKESIIDLSEQLQLEEIILDQNEPETAQQKPKRRFSGGRKQGLDIEAEIRAFELINVGDVDPIAEFDLEKFWREKGGAFPLLFKLARKILAIPASSAHAERAFSQLRRIKCDFTWASLSEESISAMICCGSLKFLNLDPE